MIRRIKSARAIGISRANPSALRHVSVADADLLDKTDVIYEIPVVEWMSFNPEKDVVFVGPVAKVIGNEKIAKVLRKLGLPIY